MTLNKPIIGDPDPVYINRIEQKTAKDFQDALEELFKHEVYAIAWTQYTPHFNDGDVCIFGVNVGANVLLTSALPDDEEYLDPDDAERLLYNMLWDDSYLQDTTIEGFDEQYLCVTSSSSTTWDYESREWKETGLVDPPAWHAAQVLVNDLQSGAYNDVLLENFGDHASVIATRNEFIVRAWEHD